MSNKYLTQKEKEQYFYKINKFYKYDKSIIDIMMKKKVLICKEKIKLEDVSKLTETQFTSLFSLAKKTLLFLNYFQITYWLDSGSLLGAVRNNKMINKKNLSKRG